MNRTAVIDPQLTSESSNRLEINAIWLMKLRWVAVAGQFITVLVVALGLGIAVRIAPLLVALTVTSVSNIGFTLWLRFKQRESKRSESPSNWNRVLVALMTLDLMVLTSLLYFTGGHTNPFVLFYFVNLALSGILLPGEWAWLLNILTILCFGALINFHSPLSELRQADTFRSISETGFATLAQKGLLVAFGACTSVIVYFATRLTAELDLRDKALRRSENKRARSERWEALGTLAAGAAHELATPLTTIAVIAREIERELVAQNASDEAIADARAISEELQRCRGILNQMSIDAGHVTAETPSPIEIGSLLEHVMDGLHRDAARVNVDRDGDVDSKTVVVPLQSTCMAIRGIVQNGLDASTDRPVDVEVSSESEGVLLRIRDHGVGMSSDVLERADEPFFSTKDVGSGMGLGRFLARTVFEKFGGSIMTESAPNLGTTVTMRIPAEERKAKS